MNISNAIRFLVLLTSVFLAALTLWPAVNLADEPGQTIADPGFRPVNGRAPGFVEALGDTRIVVLPTIVRRQERTAHSFASQDQIVAYLNAQGIAVATPGPRRIDLGPLRRPSQWEIFQAGERAIAEIFAAYDTGGDYTLIMELLVPGNQAVFGIEVYIVNRQGQSAFSFLLNAHHEMFAAAQLEARNSSEEARQEMIRKATQVGLEALARQIDHLQAHLTAQDGRFGPPMSHGRLAETVIDETSSRVSVNTDDFVGLAAEKALQLTCECAALTLDRGFRYFSIDERAELADGQHSFRILFFESPPAGRPLASVTAPEDFAGIPNLESAVLQAREFAEICRMLAGSP
ncbi:MAG: hypothetical protein EX272_13255 [Chromatiales bacterium]|nr:MAG: hypothetical protein EX272_13255 [Chromatiales bacterium]